MQHEDDARPASGLDGLHIRRIDRHAYALPDEIDRQDQPRLRALPDQVAGDALERPVRDFDTCARGDRRTRIIGKRTGEQSPDPGDLVIGNRRRLTVPVPSTTASPSAEMTRPIGTKMALRCPISTTSPTDDHRTSR